MSIYIYCIVILSLYDITLLLRNDVPKFQNSRTLVEYIYWPPRQWSTNMSNGYRESSRNPGDYSYAHDTYLIVAHGQAPCNATLPVYVVHTGS